MNFCEPTWPVPFRGRNSSGAFNQNFLWRKGNVWIMDNHRAALWCWMQDISADENVGLLHIDQHYDTRWAGMEDWLKSLRRVNLARLSIGDYLAHSYVPPGGGGAQIPVFTWDNYLSIFLKKYGRRIVSRILATHRDGDPPKVRRRFMEPRPDELTRHLMGWMEARDEARRWILNIDLDYFFFSAKNDGDQRRELFSQGYLEALFGAIREVYASGQIVSLTLCLTPGDLTGGGWSGAEALCERICKILELPFSLPAPGSVG